MRTSATFALAVTVAAAGLAAGQQPVAPAKPTVAKDAQAKAPENESPLVRAARLSTRKGKKPANVITNKTLKERGRNAHITTTTVQRPVPNIPAAPVAQAKVIEVPASVTPVDEKKNLAEAVEAIDDPFAEIDDPAVAERMAAEAAARSAAESAPKEAPPAEKPPAP